MLSWTIDKKQAYRLVHYYVLFVCQFLYTFFIPKATRTTQQKTSQYYKNKTLILDLDETLIHSVRLGTEHSPVHPSVIHTNIEVQSDKHNVLYKVYKRPHVDFFLKTISQWYKVVIYTASMGEYADPIIDWLDQDCLISQRFFRESCVFRNGNFLKDITLAEKDLCKVCLVDNSPIAFDLCKDNGIALPTWISNPNDQSLLDLLPFLDALRFAVDVRNILSLQHKTKKKRSN
ncbi:NLI interacting factor-like phosphatase-domain-containing protein [Gilbertella persicaria]|uniref:NLI interacting factor-like phosphatase-domain-containing protein n=1 Tax=Gilbertella persicaria TaxID=101096 RepID=UPI00221F4DB1|nr:NLI interacting factor-like phosphatase-domain-containing protein [Gilbertella persicaria]KAI8081879.1 NLI interacting factor-like phosphatase-domain-containing protein [Gilbertella persicaria]